MRQTLELRHRLVLQQRLLPRFEAPGPADARRGFTGLHAAHEVLCDRGTPGLLIGGLAFQAWLGTNRGSLSTRKDVDVVVLSFDSDKHPAQFEEGIDWWCASSATEGPVNGNGVQLVWSVWTGRDLEPGLYLVPMELLLRWRFEERRVLSREYDIKIPRRARNRAAWRTQPLTHEYPSLRISDLGWRFVHSRSE